MGAADRVNAARFSAAVVTHTVAISAAANLSQSCEPVILPLMETYRVVPRRGHGYRVEAMAPNGTRRLIGTWSKLRRRLCRT